MKNKWLLLLIVFVVFSAFTTTEFLKINTPYIHIQKNGESFDAGDIVYYTINISSTEYLKKFEISPDILCDTKENNTSFIFDEKTKKATINYFYVIPSHINNNSTINVKFAVYDQNTTRIINKLIRVR